MNQPLTLSPVPRAAVQIFARVFVGRFGASARGSLFLAIVLGLGLAPRPAAAVDGCKVLLCFAAPSWRSIPECVPPIQEVLRDLSLGKPFPTCLMSGAGNSASNQWASAPTYCPPQYTQVLDGESGPVYTCSYSGAVEVNINGVLWARTWWGFGGDTVTEFTPAAKAQLGTWDTRFDDDYAAWFAAQSAATQSCSTC